MSIDYQGSICQLVFDDASQRDFHILDLRVSFLADLTMRSANLTSLCPGPIAVSAKVSGPAELQILCEKTTALSRKRQNHAGTRRTNVPNERRISQPSVSWLHNSEDR
jgi:hypothetical protein